MIRKIVHPIPKSKIEIHQVTQLNPKHQVTISDLWRMILGPQIGGEKSHPVVGLASPGKPKSGMGLSRDVSPIAQM